jgi:DNA-binding GntR family transcriptional regulator
MASQALKLREKAYRSFTRPGQFISQRELVALTGQPLGAIRELIPRLEAEGLIVTVPQRGMQVAHVDLNLIRNAFQFRLMMEREAVAAFTREASDEAVSALRDAHQAIVRRADNGVDERLIDDAQNVDRDFHEALIDHLGNDIISKSYRVNWVKVRLIRQNETALHDGLVEPALTRHINNARSRAMRIAPADGNKGEDDT